MWVAIMNQHIIQLIQRLIGCQKETTVNARFVVLTETFKHFSGKKYVSKSKKTTTLIKYGSEASFSIIIIFYAATAQLFLPPLMKY
jgi:hypothetical protein